MHLNNAPLHKRSFWHDFEKEEARARRTKQRACLHNGLEFFMYKHSYSYYSYYYVKMHLQFLSDTIFSVSVVKLLYGMNVSEISRENTRAYK